MSIPIKIKGIAPFRVDAHLPSHINPFTEIGIGRGATQNLIGWS
jgi:hypothetical protein